MNTQEEVKNKMSEDSFYITNKTKSTLPRVPFAKIKEEALGKDYSLSLVFIGKRKSATLNYSYREKNKPTNILSFPLDKKTGEIFITLELTREEAKKFERKHDNFIAFLFIHGLMHLKGMEHGSRMEEAEAKLRKQFLV
ncbi:MAG: putative rRNA maturation factor [Patescibacteria group bacterium]|nr:putative rRNA maturation factor [Patescibacteria group bacterium]